MTEERLDGLLGELGARIFQQAWIVEDRSAAEAAMQGALGCSDFVDLEMDQEWTYRGRKVPCALALGFARSGNMQIELMQPLRGEGIHVEFLERHGSGPHHLGCFVDDLEAAIAVAERSGFPAVMSTDFGPVRLSYVDTYASLGFYLELIEDRNGTLWSFMPWRDPE
jgi:methylmalonyl-CoA/ethylmalonyl-CoA epimerase